MVDPFCMLSVLMSVLALWIALSTAGKQRQEQEQKTKKDKRPPVKSTNADKRRMAVLRQQQANFMGYDGGVQLPVDPNIIQADSEN